MFDIQKQEAIM